MPTHEEHDRLADKRDQQADELEQESERLGEQIDKTREQWEARRRDPAVPGAPPPAENEDEDTEDG